MAPAAKQCRGLPVHVGEQDEQDRGHQVDHRRDHVLDGVQPLEPLGHEDAEQGDQDHALRRAEVAAVDAGQVDADEQRPRVLAFRAAAGIGASGTAGGHHACEPWLDGHQEHGEEDQDRNDLVERALRQAQQQDAAGQAPQPTDDREPHDAISLAGQFAPVADGPAQRSQHQPDGVGDVRDQRRVAEGQQGGKGDQRAGADDGVDRARGHAGRDDGHDLERTHRPRIGQRHGLIRTRRARAKFVDARTPRTSQSSGGGLEGGALVSRAARVAHRRGLVLRTCPVPGTAAICRRDGFRGHGSIHVPHRRRGHIRLRRWPAARLASAVGGDAHPVHRHLRLQSLFHLCLPGRDRGRRRAVDRLRDPARVDPLHGRHRLFRRSSTRWGARGRWPRQPGPMGRGAVRDRHRGRALLRRRVPAAGGWLRQGGRRTRASTTSSTGRPAPRPWARASAASSC